MNLYKEKSVKLPRKRLEMKKGTHWPLKLSQEGAARSLWFCLSAWSWGAAQPLLSLSWKTKRQFWKFPFKKLFRVSCVHLVWVTEHISHHMELCPANIWPFSSNYLRNSISATEPPAVINLLILVRPPPLPAVSNHGQVQGSRDDGCDPTKPLPISSCLRVPGAQPSPINTPSFLG